MLVHAIHSSALKESVKSTFIDKSWIRIINMPLGLYKVSLTSVYARWESAKSTGRVKWVTQHWKQKNK